MDTIVLKGKKELDVFINPQRQRLLRCMNLAGEPLTPKQIADRMALSPSSVQHHLRKLLALGLVEPHHTETIHGITARYYRVAAKTVRIGSLTENTLLPQRMALLQALLGTVFEGYAAYCAANPAPAVQAAPYGDLLSGIVRLTPEEARTVQETIRGFLDAHERQEAVGEPWEYALIAYPAGEVRHG